LVDSSGSDARDIVSSPIIGIQVPENSGQVHLGSNPTNTIINITLSL
jgi:hypothetical protein